MAGRSGAGWGSLVLGALSAAAIPLAVYATRFSGSYEMLHASFAIPVAAVLGFAALSLARRSRRLREVRLDPGGRGPAPATAGRALGALGLFLAASAVVALVVYGLLEYAGSRG